MRTAALSGLGAHRPPNRVGNDLIAERLDSSDEWIQARSGIVTRGFASPAETVVNMAASAGEKALAAAGVAASDVDLVVVASCTLTRPAVPAAEQVARILGLDTAAAVDLGAACAGFTYGLSLAADAVRAGSADNVLVIGSERFTDVVDPHDRSTAFLFGDGAGAGVVSVADSDGISPPAWLSDGTQSSVLEIVGVPPRLRMDGQAVYRWAIKTLPVLARAVCERAGIALSELAGLVPHQANLRIIESLVRSLDLSPDVVVGRDVVDSGNTSAASIPLALTRLMEDGQLVRGDLVLLLGFGAGLTAAGQIVRCP
jgi:3-oxoacyl-[acyl-carrier-protein] synthase-3